MKKVLITGMNKAQTTKDYFLGQHLKIVPSHYALIRCLEDMGYEVEQRYVALGEEKKDYDHVIVYLHSPASFCQNLYQGLYTLSLYPDAILAFDDWQVDQIYGNLVKFRDDLIEKPDDYCFRQFLLDQQYIKYDLEEYKKYRQVYIDSVNLIMNNNSKFLISAFAGGDISQLGIKSNRIFTFNPNPYHYNRTPQNDFLGEKKSLFDDGIVEPANKLREWNFASLMQNKTKKWLKQQNISWPINMYGQMKGEEKNERLTEDKMCRVYHEQWGCLMPGYFHNKSGWWRARPLQVADAGSILIGDKEELNILYRDETLSSYKASDIEQMDLSQLIQTAKNQRDALYSIHPLNKNVTQQELETIFNA